MSAGHIASNKCNRPKAGPECRSRLRTRRPRNRVWNPATEEIFCSSERSDRLWSPPRFMFSVHTSCAFPRDNTDLSHPSSYDVQNVCNYTSTTLYLCMAIKYKVANFGVMSPRKLCTPAKGNIFRWVHVWFHGFVARTEWRSLVWRPSRITSE